MDDREFSQERFNDFVIRHNVIGFFEEAVKLVSGRMCNHYVSYRSVMADPALLDELVSYPIAFVREKGLDPDCFFGVPEGGTKLGLFTQYHWVKGQPNYGEGSHVLPMGRGQPKEHGNPRDRYFLGFPRGKTIVIEDTTTTGGSLMKTIQTLQESDVKVIAAVVLINRDEKRDDGKTVAEAFREIGVPYYAMTHIIDVLPAVVEKLKPSEKVKRAVEDYFARYGERTISLS